MNEFIRVEPFKREHLQFLHERKQTTSTTLVPGQLDIMESDPWTITLMVESEVLLCGGIHRHWEGRAECWAVVSERARLCPAAVFRAAYRLIELAQKTIRRIEAVVNPEDPKAVRLVERLGFRRQSVRMRYYFPDGSDGILYARFRREITNG